ncbi:phospholipase C, phosphocholine-specific [Sphingomonas sp. KR3-1]|uniref:phosphocholine-specific phospholipase C n=1 Tax=Sphingomonas sp. KR3-1 TaxID=3156611 RepID=UPI0032B3FBFE
MPDLDRRSLLLGATAAAALPASIARALAVPADRRTGTIRDVEHVVILMQENRGFDHYFGTLRGVRGFADRFPIPVAPGRDVWRQLDRRARGGPRISAPFHLDTRRAFELMRMKGTPHGWPDAQQAWDKGRMAHWTEAKTERAMGHYRRADIAFQFALADAFTICDAYHCSIQTGTNTNRLFLWTGTNDPGGTRGGPSIDNSHDDFPEGEGARDSYRWTSYVERLQAAGIDWRIYQDMTDNFTDNPLAGFEKFRAAHRRDPGHDPALLDRALTSRLPEQLRADVLAGKLPQVSYIIAPSADSEHPGPSSPAQGAAYTARILDALTADPTVWARTVFLVMFDENDGFFDHVPPPAPPSQGAGASKVDTTGEYHLAPSTGDAKIDLLELRGRPYGLGPRVPFYAISPWSRGGWVCSQVFDHTSVIRFLEARFGVAEPNISPWRRAVCGDLTAAFDFANPNARLPAAIPDPRPDAARAAAVPRQVAPAAPAISERLAQEPGTRPSRALPYAPEVSTIAADRGAIALRLETAGSGAVVLHVYDRLNLDRVPRRYTLVPGTYLEDNWRCRAGDGAYDLWVLGPNGFHRHFAGSDAADAAARAVRWELGREALTLRAEAGTAPLRIVANAYRAHHRDWTPGPAAAHRSWPLAATRGWYDLTIECGAHRRRLAGRFETGYPSISDPALA